MIFTLRYIKCANKMLYGLYRYNIDPFRASGVALI